MRRNSGECHDRRSPRGSDLGIGVLVRRHERSIFRCPADVRHALAQFAGLDLLQRVVHEERRLNTCVICDEVQIRPILCGFGQVARMTSFRIRRSRRQAFVNADVVETRFRGFQFLIILLDQLERGISNRFVVVAPLAHQAVRIVIDLCSIRDVVALPRVGFVLLDLFLNISKIAFADIQKTVSQHPCGTGNLVHKISRGRGLCGRQQFSGHGFLVISGWPVLVRAHVYNGCCDVAQEADGDLTVEVHIRYELNDLGIRGDIGQTDECWIPNSPHVATLVAKTSRIHGIRSGSGC